VSDPRLTEAGIERSLRDLGVNLAYPPTPDLASAVRARLAQASPLPAGEGARRAGEGVLAGRGDGPTPAVSRAEREPTAHSPSQRRWTLFSPRPRPALAAAAALLAAVLVLAVWPDARTAVADALGLPGVLISRVPSVPVRPGAVAPARYPAAGRVGYPAPGVGTTAPPPLRLGEPTTLEGVRQMVPFRVLQPGALGRPDELYLDPATAGGQVAFVYRPRSGLPATADPQIGALFTEFQAGLEPGFVAKGLGPDTRLEMLTVNGGRGVWIEGRPHLFYYRDRDGEIRDESVRLAGNVLLWEQEGLTLRLEANVPKDEAVRLASSVR